MADVSPSFRKLQERLKSDKEALESWQALGRKYDLSAAIPWRIVHQNYMPVRADIRRKLGLAEFLRVPVRRGKDGRFVSVDKER